MRGCACRGTSGFAHVSCLAEQAKILMDEAEENNLSEKVQNERWDRWNRCSLCEQDYHGIVRCALGWACWKTYLGRPEADELRHLAMNILGNGLFEDRHFEDALSVREANLAMLRRLGAREDDILAVQSNLASNYEMLGQIEPALSLQRGVYFGLLKLYGEEHQYVLSSANNYADLLKNQNRFEDANSLLRSSIPVARRVLGDSHISTLRMRWTYAQSLYKDPGATLDDLREAVTTIEDVERIARRVLGGAHPLAVDFVHSLQKARAALAARDVEALRVGAMRV